MATSTPEIVMFVVYPICTLGVVYSIKCLIDALKSLGDQISELSSRFGKHQIEMEHRLSNLEAKVNE